MLYHSELNLLSQLAALDLPSHRPDCRNIRSVTVVTALLQNVKALQGDCAMSAAEWKNR